MQSYDNFDIRIFRVTSVLKKWKTKRCTLSTAFKSLMQVLEEKKKFRDIKSANFVTNLRHLEFPRHIRSMRKYFRRGPFILRAQFSWQQPLTQKTEVHVGISVGKGLHLKSGFPSFVACLK